jgi:flagellar biosynthesis protein FlhG
MTEGSAVAPWVGARQSAGLERGPRVTPFPTTRAPGSALTIAVTSGKGGVGKTTVTANLATLFARMGRRTLVVDADLGLAGLDLALGVLPPGDLGDVLDGRLTVEDVLVSGPFGVTLLPAAPGRTELASLGLAARATLLRGVARVAARFDVVVIDTGAGIGSTVLDFVASADEVLLVTTPDPLALRDAYAMVKAMRTRSDCRELRVLTNLVHSRGAGLAAYQRLTGLVDRFLDTRLTYGGAIHHDVSVAEANRHGVPFVLSEPSAPPARVLSDLARSLDRGIARVPC